MRVLGASGGLGPVLKVEEVAEGVVKYANDCRTKNRHTITGPSREAIPQAYKLASTQARKALEQPRAWAHC